MSEIVLHIGTHKTGSTTIQRTLSHNRARLERHGIVYPQFGSIAPHHHLATPWIDLREAYHGDRPAREDWAALVATHAPGNSTVVVSSEEFSRLRPTSVDFTELGRIVAPFGRKRVVCVLRNQIGFIQSIFLQMIKFQAYQEFSAYLSGVLQSRYATGLALDYGDLLDHLLTGFSADQLVLMRFEAEPGQDGLLARFCAAAGLAVDPRDVALLPTGDSNVSPDPLVLWIANRLAGPSRRPKRFILPVQEALAEVLGPGARTTLYARDQVRAVRRVFAPLNEIFRRRLDRMGIEFDLAPLALPPDTVHRDEVDIERLMRLAHAKVKAQALRRREDEEASSAQAVAT